jgi:acyl-CoA thioester hydrolase
MTEPFSLELKVRDYECDLQGVVNNAVYQNYLEHARHEFLLKRGIDFAAFAAAGINLVVIRAELDYKLPLQSGDQFRVTTTVERLSPVRFAFCQQVQRLPDAKLAVAGRIIGTALNQRGRPQLPEGFAEKLLGAEA